MWNKPSKLEAAQDFKKLEELFKLEEFNTLETKVKELIKKYPENTNLQNILGISLQVQNKLSESFKIFNEIIKSKPDFYLAYYNLGNLYKQTLNLKAAKDSYEKCIKINSNYLEAYIGLGRILLDLMNLAESKKIFESSFSISFTLESIESLASSK